MLARLALLLGLLLTAACASSPTPVARERPLVILVSIDGFHPDYLTRGVTPVLSKLAAGGASGAMRPSFPSKTFPNHYTLVTGLVPDRHGVVDNTMTDPSIPGVTFTQKNSLDGNWWDDATPIWVSAERAGLKTATLFWPGSEAEIRGVRPSRFLAFDQSLPSAARADRLLSWLDEGRPAFATLYFDEVDTAGHNLGPNSPRLNTAVASVDAAIGRLVEGLAARRIAANIVVTADHGMAETSRDRVIVLDDVVAMDAIKPTFGWGAYVTLSPVPGREAEVAEALSRPHANMSCWTKDRMPDRFRYGTHVRTPPWFCLPRTGWSIVPRARLAGFAPVGGNHGYDPADPAMLAVFIGSGPAFLPGAKVAPFDNVDVYPMLMRLIGLPPEPNDGDLDELGPVLTR